jgi:hypothetical protein
MHEEEMPRAELEPMATLAEEVAVTPAVSTPRRSGRFADAADGSSATDEDSLSRAMRRKAAQNLDSAGISPTAKDASFLSFSKQRISSQLSSIGVSLGSSDSDISISAKALRHMEFDRLKVVPNTSAFSEYSHLDEEEANATSDGQLLTHLIGEVSEVDLDEDRLSPLYELRASGRKSKSASRRMGLKTRI